MTKTLTGVSDVVIHLDERWAECTPGRHGSARFPMNGLVAEIIEDRHVNTQGIRFVSVLATCAASGVLELPLNVLLPDFAKRLGLDGADALAVAGQWAAQHVDTLVRRGYIALASGGGV